MEGCNNGCCDGWCDGDVDGDTDLVGASDRYVVGSCDVDGSFDGVKVGTPIGLADVVGGADTVGRADTVGCTVGNGVLGIWSLLFK